MTSNFGGLKDNSFLAITTSVSDSDVAALKPLKQLAGAAAGAEVQETAGNRGR